MTLTVHSALSLGMHSVSLAAFSYESSVSRVSLSSECLSNSPEAVDELPN